MSHGMKHRAKPLDTSNIRSTLHNLPTFASEQAESVGKVPSYPLEAAGGRPLRSGRMAILPFLARGASQVGVSLRTVVDAWLHPRSTVQRWREARRWPRPDDFERMGSAKFDAYIEKIGFDARITTALAEPIVDGVPISRDGGVEPGGRAPEPEREGVAAIRPGSHSG